MDGLITVQTYAQYKERSTRKHYNIAVRSGAGPSAVGTERDRWSICACPTHRSSPMEALHKNKRRSDDSLDFYLSCLRQSSVRGCRFNFVFPPPSRIYELCYK